MDETCLAREREKERGREREKRADKCVLLFVRKAERNGWKGEAKKRTDGESREGGV